MRLRRSRGSQRLELLSNGGLTLRRRFARSLRLLQRSANGGVRLRLVGLDEDLQQRIGRDLRGVRVHKGIGQFWSAQSGRLLSKMIQCMSLAGT